MNKKLKNLYTYAFSETEDGLQTLYVVAPGRKSEDFTVDIAENILTVRFDETVREFELTDFVNQGKIEAKYEAGILHIDLPMKEKHKPREIKVR